MSKSYIFFQQRENSHKINHLRVNNQVVYHTVHPLPLSSSKTFSSARKETPSPLNSCSQIPTPHPPPGSTNLVTVYLDLPIPDISQKQNPTTCDLLCLAFSLNNVIKFIHVVAGIYPYFIPFVWLNHIPRRVHTILYSFIY